MLQDFPTFLLANLDFDFLEPETQLNQKPSKRNHEADVALGSILNAVGGEEVLTERVLPDMVLLTSKPQYSGAEAGGPLDLKASLVYT
ncbi:hypothetical protein STEG23_020985, partial [Scotinomys teguina]